MSKSISRIVNPLPKGCVVVGNDAGFSFITGVSAYEESNGYIIVYNNDNEVHSVFFKDDGDEVIPDHIIIDNRGFEVSFYDRLEMEQTIYDNRARVTEKQVVPEPCKSCPYFGYFNDERDDEYGFYQHCCFTGADEDAPCCQPDWLEAWDECCECDDCDDYDECWFDDECDFTPDDEEDD